MELNKAQIISSISKVKIDDKIEFHINRDMLTFLGILFATGIATGICLAIEFIPKLCK